MTPGAPVDDTVAALAGQVERLARKLAVLEGAVATLAQPGQGAPPMQSWLWPTGDLGQGAPGRVGANGSGAPPRIGAYEAAALFDDLADWLARVYLRYEGATLPTCWAWHPDVVEELLWLRGAHADSYEGRFASWQRVGDWHDRQRPGVVKRIRQAAATCELRSHTDSQRSRAVPTVPLADQLGLVAAAWSHRHEVPEPTATSLAAAERHDRNGTGHRPSAPQRGSS